MGAISMHAKTKFHGIIPPIPSVLYENGKIDETGMRNLIDFLIESKVDGLFFNGSGGEFSQMSINLRRQMARFGVNYVNGRIPVLIGTGSASTEETIALSLHAKEIGADGVVIVNPYYWKLSEESLYQHYCQIADAVDLPILLYNFPTLTGQDLTPELVYNLAKEYPHIVGIKETVEDIGHTREIILKVKSERPDFAVFSGYDDQLLNTLCTGGDGSIPLTASFAPELFVGIYQAFKAGNYEKAIQLHRKLTPLLSLYKLDSPFVNVAKETIKLRGIDISTEVLAPLRPLNEEKKQELERLATTYLSDFLQVTNEVE